MKTAETASLDTLVPDALYEALDFQLRYACALACNDAETICQEVIDAARTARDRAVKQAHARRNLALDAALCDCRARASASA